MLPALAVAFDAFSVEVDLDVAVVLAVALAVIFAAAIVALDVLATPWAATVRRVLLDLAPLVAAAASAAAAAAVFVVFDTLSAEMDDDAFFSPNSSVHPVLLKERRRTA